jgi:transposase InsO family protein
MAGCYPFTLRDGYSRFVLRCTALPSVRGEHTTPQLVRAFADYGLPQRIRSDNGPPFGQPTSLAPLSRLAVWWLRLGVWPERITPGRPGQNGAHEQFHRVLKRETACPPAGSQGAQQALCRLSPGVQLRPAARGVAPGAAGHALHTVAATAAPARAAARISHGLGGASGQGRWGHQVGGPMSLSHARAGGGRCRPRTD